MLGNIRVQKCASRVTNVGQYSCLKKVFRGTQMLGNIRVQKVLRRTRVLEDFDVGLFSCRFEADKQVGAQSGFGKLTCWRF